MDAVIFNVLIIFGTIFAIIYVAVAARTRVRLALIEKGADASIFYSAKQKKSNILPLILVNLSLLLVFVGIGIFAGAILVYSFKVFPEVAYPGTIFTMAGIGLFAGYKISSKIVEKQS
ncbi:MAG TPA: DUF6249 domain-containing protein [Chitinophagaceae bacterium]|nr:DUF6249 domain-containing protein [Chitinophagaceae bacterium]